MTLNAWPEPDWHGSISLGRDQSLASSFVLQGKDGPLLTIHSDGRVEGSVENASEAGRVFVEFVRANWRIAPTPSTE